MEAYFVENIPDEKIKMLHSKFQDHLAEWRKRLVRKSFDTKVIIFFSIRVFFTDTDDSKDSRGRQETIFSSTLPLLPTHEYWDIYLQLCMWDDYHIFLIAPLVFTRLLLDEIYHLIELPFEWLIDDAMFVFFTWWIDIRLLLQRFDIGNRWIWTHIDYHPCITSALTNQVC